MKNLFLLVSISFMSFFTSCKNTDSIGIAQETKQATALDPGVGVSCPGRAGWSSWWLLRIHHPVVALPPLSTGTAIGSGFG